MGIQHQEFVPPSFGQVAANNYLGSPAVTSRLIAQYCAETEADINELRAGRMGTDKFLPGLQVRVHRYADIFSGRDAAYQTIKGYHESTLRYRLMADLGEYWQSHRAKWGDDPVCVMFEWLAVLIAEKVKLADGDDMLLGIMLGPSVEYATKVMLDTVPRVASVSAAPVSDDLAKSHITGYTKSDGTVVKPHEDKRVTTTKPQPKAYHPKLGDKGQKVGIYSPHIPAVAALSHAGEIATITPGCEMPESLNGIPFSDWTPPESDDQWDYVEGQKDDLVEPDLHCPIGKQPASGLVIVETDGRVWLVSPTNKFGGYKNTFPKGKVEEEMSFQANAIKEAWEEAGIKANIVGLLGDVERTTSVTRYYLARRVAGNPAKHMTWESQAVHLCPISKLTGFLDAKVDHQVVDLMAR